VKKYLIFLIILFFSYSDIKSLEKIRDYDEQILFLFSLSHKFTVAKMGTINYPENNYQLYRITYNETDDFTTKRYLIISGIHGLEIAPIFSIKDFILYLDSKDTPIKNVTIDFVYILNPYGFEYNTRYNGNEMDINRDFIKLETQEINLLINSIKGINYSGMYDFHEHSATSGFMLYYYSQKNKKIANDILDIMNYNNFLLESKYKDVILRSRNGKIYVPFYAKLYWTYYLKQATTGLYFNRIKTNEVFVIETPLNANMESRKTMTNLVLNYLTENDKENMGSNGKNIAITVTILILLTAKLLYRRIKK
jgi:phage pi2 protein 07